MTEVSVDEYIAAAPDKFRPIVEELRALVRTNLPDGYEEVMRWGMITYEVPLEVSGKTYNGKPLMYAAIGAQKRHVGLYLCGLYCVPGHLEGFQATYEAAGLKLDMGKACVRIKKPQDILRPAIAETIAAIPVADFVAASAR